MFPDMENRWWYHDHKLCINLWSEYLLMRVWEMWRTLFRDIALHMIWARAEWMTRICTLGGCKKLRVNMAVTNLYFQGDWNHTAIFKTIIVNEGLILFHFKIRISGYSGCTAGGLLVLWHHLIKTQVNKKKRVTPDGRPGGRGRWCQWETASHGEHWQNSTLTPT